MPKVLKRRPRVLILNYKTFVRNTQIYMSLQLTSLSEVTGSSSNELSEEFHIEQYGLLSLFEYSNVDTISIHFIFLLQKH